MKRLQGDGISISRFIRCAGCGALTQSFAAYSGMLNKKPGKWCTHCLKASNALPEDHKFLGDSSIFLHAKEVEPVAKEQHVQPS